MDNAENLMLLQRLYAGVLFVTGLMIGSFLNVVVYRTPLGKSILHPPSACPKCGARIAPYDNIPVVGWLNLRGRCRSCGNPISVRYPAVELTTGLLWAAVGWRLAGLNAGYYSDMFIGLIELAFVSAMVVTFLVDWDHLIILDEISLGGLAVALIAAPFLPELHHAVSADEFFLRDPLLGLLTEFWPSWARSLAAAAAGGLAGLGFSLFIYYAGSAVFRSRIEAARKKDPEIDSALGMGDVKLMACLGTFLGWMAVFHIYIGGCLLGVVAGAAMKLRSGDAGGLPGFAGLARRWRTGDSVIPFGPFLSVAAVAVYFMSRGILPAVPFLFPQ